MKTVETILARRYAKAFLNCFNDQLTEKDLHQIDLLQKFLEKNRSVSFFLSLTHIDIEVKKQYLQGLLEQFYMIPATISLITVLLTAGRGALLSSVLKYIGTLYKQKNNIEAFSIITSHQLPPEQLAVVIQFLVDQLGSKITFTQSIDKTLIAGMRLQSNTRLWEYSIRKQLKDLSDTLTL